MVCPGCGDRGTRDCNSCRVIDAALRSAPRPAGRAPNGEQLYNINCSTCNRNGYGSNNANCNVCNGRGEITILASSLQMLNDAVAENNRQMEQMLEENREFRENLYNRPVVTCSNCNGTGQNPVRSSVGRYDGVTRTHWCDLCQERGYPHYHQPCPVCRGAGGTRR